MKADAKFSSSVFFAHPSNGFRAAKIKSFFSILQIFGENFSRDSSDQKKKQCIFISTTYNESHKPLLHCWTCIQKTQSSHLFRKSQGVKTSSLFQALPSAIRSILSSIISSLTSLPLSKAGAKVGGLFYQPNLTHTNHALNMVSILIYSTETTNLFLNHQTEKEDDNSIRDDRAPLW